MKNSIARTFVGMAVLASTAFAATSHAAEVTINGWAFGAGNEVHTHGVVNDFTGLAGGFSGSLASADGSPPEAVVAYSIELEESFTFSADAMQGYTLVDGASYFERRRGDASIAARMGRLITYARNTRSFNNAAGSTALQLAIWNMVYDTDNTLSTASGTFQDSSQYQTQADALLNGVNNVRVGIYDVFALEMAGGQDFLVFRSRIAAAPQPNAVPEPASLALVMVALGGVGFAGRKRRQA